MEICMLALLMAAFLTINMLSLIYMIMIAVGMAAPSQPRRRIWRRLFVPLLGLLLLQQYSVLIGLPPVDSVGTQLPPHPLNSSSAVQQLFALGFCFPSTFKERTEAQGIQVCSNT